MEGFAGADLNGGVSAASLGRDGAIELVLVAVLVGGAVMLVRWLIRKSREEAQAAADLTSEAIDAGDPLTVLDLASMVPEKTFQIGQWPLPLSRAQL